MDRLHVPYSDPDAVDRILAGPTNRRALATFRLLVDLHDSLAWATLLLLSPGIGQGFREYIYERARATHVQFGQELLNSCFVEEFPGAPASAPRAGAVIRDIVAWLAEHAVPDEMPEGGWGHWMVAMAGGPVLPHPTGECVDLLHALDVISEEGVKFVAFLSQLAPLAKDRAVAESRGVRIMTMASSKGLTARAVLVAGVENDIVPRPDGDLAEERRLLYVAMTRAREFLFCTWARSRRGPTARAGRERVRQLRRYSHFLLGGPVRSRDGLAYLRRR